MRLSLSLTLEHEDFATKFRSRQLFAKFPYATVKVDYFLEVRLWEYETKSVLVGI